MKLTLLPAIVRKLRDKHQVAVHEVEETFLNRTGRIAKDVRHAEPPAPPRFWFIAETDTGRRLKVVYAMDKSQPHPVLITAYPPNQKEEQVYATLK